MDKTSNEPKKAQGYDPGWNDPPKLCYNTQQTTPNRPRNFLNKRVAFPLSTTPSEQPPAPMSLPPMSNAPTLPLPNMHPIQLPLLPMGPTLNPKEDLESHNSLKEVTKILMQLLESSSELGPKANDIKRRISVMEDMWLSGKLNARIHQQMKELAYALKDDQPTKADDIHKALMVDHVSSVGVWMPGVKQLVHNCIARSELFSIEKNDD